MKLATIPLVRAVACAAVLALALPVGAQAQIGGMLKRKIKEKVKGSEPAAAVTEKSAPAATTTRSPYGEYVLEIDADVAGRLVTALKREKAYRDSVDAFVAKLPTPQAYGECQMKVMQRPDIQKLYEGEHTAEELMAIGQKTQAATEKACGPDPSTMKSAKYNAAREAPKAGAEAGHFTKTQYDILKERALPFCVKKPAGEDGAKIPGSGTNIYYVYSAGEVEQLNAQCGVLLPLLKSQT
ncbi:MAG TPA: hypothetical protein VFQ38_05280 [Longimicrobiales bacterium]|nr:hypothetical protein [Longimicrobiales bacterium]